LTLIVNITLLLFGILVRDNSFTATPALLFLTLYGYDAELLKTKSWPAKSVIALSSLSLAFLFMKGINSFFLSDNMGSRDNKKSYLVEQLCKYDLIGMSVLCVYNILPIYWTVKIDDKCMRNDFDIFAE
jgi:hypothetical protein